MLGTLINMTKRRDFEEEQWKTGSLRNARKMVGGYDLSM